MSIRDILLYLQPDEPCHSRLAFAAQLANRWRADLSALCALVEPEVSIADSFAVGTQAVGEVIGHRHEATERATTPHRTAFQAACCERAMPCHWMLSGPGEGPGGLALAARCHDLAIVGLGGQTSRRLAELVALDSGTPCLVVPEGPSASASFDRIVLAWDGSRQARRTLGEGMIFLEQAKSVRLVTAGQEPGEAGVTEVSRHLAAHGVRAEFERISAGEETGATLLDYCAGFSADLMIMGAYARSAVAEMVLGGATRTILTRASLPVLMAH